MRRERIAAVIGLVLLGSGVRGAAPEDLGLSVAPGFRVTLYADQDLANDIFAMTLDSRGQVVVTGGIAYIGHMHSPHGTSIVDVADPAHPRLLARLEMPPGTHSHKVRVDNGLMLINRERNHADKNAPPENFRGGLGVYDVTKPASTREITRWETDGWASIASTSTGATPISRPLWRAIAATS